MANHRSALKRVRQTAKRTLRNKAIRTRLRSALKAFRELLQNGNTEDAQKQLKATTQIVRKAASKGVLHNKTASRHVSRLELALNRATQQ